MMEKRGEIIKRIKNVSAYTWILLAIILAGIFLRVYHFRDWLLFCYDQVRDLTIVENVLHHGASWPVVGSDMGSTAFHVGPVYNYFQIISGFLFGARPETMAYPDLFFSVLTIPLLYYFLKRYFSREISLALTGIYAVSFYAIRYSRFAWNTNPIPFFALLFLISLHELLVNREKVRWRWIILLGISLGIGIQLHAILIFLFPATAFFVFLYALRINWKDKLLWKKGIVVFLLMIILNAGQIAGDINNNFANAKAFLENFTDKTQEGKSNFLSGLVMNIDCNMQANFHMLSSLGERNNCYFFYAKSIGEKKNSGLIKRMKNPSYLFRVFFAAIFSLTGYGLCLYCFTKEQDRIKKCFLGLILLYAAFSFLVMFPIEDGLKFRYFIHIMLLSFIFLGIIINFLAKLFPKHRLFIIVFISMLPVISNGYTISTEAKNLINKRGSDYKYAILDEMEPIANYVAQKSDLQKKAYIVGNPSLLWTFFDPIMYLDGKKGIAVGKLRGSQEIPSGNSLFYLTSRFDNFPQGKISDHEIMECRNFGQTGICQLEN